MRSEAISTAQDVTHPSFAQRLPRPPVCCRLGCLESIDSFRLATQRSSVDSAGVVSDDHVEVTSATPGEDRHWTRNVDVNAFEV